MKGELKMQNAATSPQFLTPAQVTARWNKAVSIGTLANWRSKGTGPVYQKFGTRVRYPIDALVTWEANSLKSVEILQELKASQANDNKKGNAK